MDDRFFLNSPSQSPFKTGLPSTSINTDFTANRITPVKKEPLSFSPFKTTGMSPFKIINLSPAKGTYDEWDKDFIASFEENLFGMEDGIISPTVIEDILKSPAGKAMLENRISPLRMRNTPAVRRLKISPQNKNTTKLFQSLSQSDDSGIENIASDYLIKEEVTTNDFLYGQTVDGANSNTLSAIDPNKMSATPIKPGQAHSDNVPKRKLAMKMPVQTHHFQSYVIQDNALSGIQQVKCEWPSKERLKFARSRFQEVLNMAVEREREILKEQKRKKNERITKANNKENKNQTKTKSGKGGKGGKMDKSKGKGKKTKNDKYPQIKMALSKPKKGSGNKSYKISKQLFSASYKNNDLGWYPDEDEDFEEEEDDAWTGPVPFNVMKNNSYLNENEAESSEDEELATYRFETQSGRQVTWKKRRLY